MSAQGDGGALGKGDEVWIKRRVRTVDVGPDGPAYRCVGVSTWDTDALPDSPALPGVARWLAEHPDAVRLLGLIEALVTVVCDDVLYDGDEGPLQFACTPQEFRDEIGTVTLGERKALRALVAALDTGGG